LSSDYENNTSYHLASKYIAYLAENYHNVLVGLTDGIETVSFHLLPAFLIEKQNSVSVSELTRLLPFRFLKCKKDFAIPYRKVSSSL
jgi:hypothetical protein